MALSKNYHLTREDSEYVFKKGKTVKNSFFFIRFLENKIGHYRIAILVSLMVSKSSVVRNRIRRIVSGILKTAILWNYPFDIVFVATPGIVGKPSREIKSGLMDVINTLFVK